MNISTDTLTISKTFNKTHQKVMHIVRGLVEEGVLNQGEYQTAERMTGAGMQPYIELSLEAAIEVVGGMIGKAEFRIKRKAFIAELLTNA